MSTNNHSHSTTTGMPEGKASSILISSLTPNNALHHVSQYNSDQAAGELKRYIKIGVNLWI